ncbi:uridine kinase family protein [Arthrobacter sp. R4]|uniref:uridine kinase family protein n=1 Tax=Arthrobacter sp. R4 TaxID=644417 RepID=UPI003EDA68BA
MPLQALVTRLFLPAEAPTGRPKVIAIDGRGGAGKTHLASRLQQHIPRSTVVHTDDVAWYHSFFGWQALMIDGVLKPVWQGEEVYYRPPGWVSKDRAGSIKVPAGLGLVVVEGTGASRPELQPWLDASIWVHSDPYTAADRLVQRDGDAEAERLLRQEWDAEEEPFLRSYQPWSGATIIIDGTSALTHSEHEVVVAGTA